MTESVVKPESIASIEARLASIERRLSALETHSVVTPETEAFPQAPMLRDGTVANVSSHIGRALLIFGGAYLLRAITDFQFVPTGIGILLGAAYAVFWLFACNRRARNERHKLNASVLGAISVVLMLPLLLEATQRFSLLSGTQSIVALAVYYLFAMEVAAARELRLLAWLVTLGGIVTAIAIMISAHVAIVTVAFLAIVALATLWTTYTRDWLALEWFGGAGAGIGVAALVVLSSSERWAIEPQVAAAVSIVLLFVYLASFVMRTQIQRKSVGLFEAVITFVTAGLAFWAIVAAASAGRFELPVLGICTAILGIALYAIALAPETRRRRGRNFYFYSNFGLVFIMAGSALFMSPAAAATLWSLMALAAAVISGRMGWVSLSLQCTSLLLIAAAYSGILLLGWQALAGNPSAGWPEPQITHYVIALTTVACLFVPIAQRSKRWGALAGMPQLLVLALSVWEVGGLMVVLLGPVLAGIATEDPNLAVLAALRTAVLSAASITLALSSRYHRWPEARWLAYPVLMLVGIKLFLEDFPHGQAATLFVALAFVGSALLLVARFLRREEAGG